MAKVVLLGDTHLGIRKHSDLFANYINKFFDDWFFPFCEKNDIEHVIQLGDLVDTRKYINSKTLAQLHNNYFGQFEKRKINLYQMIGNHDVYYKNTNDVNWIDGVLQNSNYSYIQTFGQPSTVDIDGLPIDIIPWINNTNESDIFKFIKKSKSKYLCGHLELAGFELTKGHESTHGHLAKQFKKYKKVFTGHYHISSEQGNILYTGIPYQLTFADVDDKKGIWIFDTETGEYEFIQYDDRLFNKVIYDDSFDVKSFDYKSLSNTYVKVVVKEKTDKKLFDAFIIRMQSCNCLLYTSPSPRDRG